MKIFISQAMNSIPNSEIETIRNKAISKLKNEFGKIEIIDSYIPDEYTDPKNNHIKNKPAYFLGKVISLLADADLVVFLGNWKTARGCQIEHLVCQRYGIPIKEF